MKLLKLIHKRVRLPNGYLAGLDIVKHPGAALVVPYLTQDKVIFIRQFRPVINGYLYELPAGTVNLGESVISCARREVVEEVGYRAKNLIKLGVIYPVPGYSTERIVIYKAKGLKKCSFKSEKDEIIEPHVFNLPQVRKLFKSGKITDAKTICALAFIGWV